MKPLMAGGLYLQHVAQLEAMKARHEINRMENLQVLDLKIVLVNNFHDKSKDNFTAWINASARDTIVDDRTGNKIRGDTGSGVFEEFWAFRREGESWLLDAIDQPEEGMDIINKENFDSLVPKSTLERQYEKAGGPAIRNIGAAATREREESTVGLGMAPIKEKAGRVSRLLNFLAESDKAWDETKMRAHVRALFISFNVGLELGDILSVRDNLSPALYGKYQKEMAALAAKKQKIQKRNLALRNAEIVLVKNYYDNKKDEFTAWLSGQSQTVIVDAKTEKVAEGDSHVTDFEEYWTFRRDGASWVLVSIEKGFKKYVEEENFDEGSGKVLMDWYYKQDRA
jgi:predicted lipid-binding transport protein (Tim44 family)